MTVIYQPSKLLARLASKKKIEKLVSSRLTVNRAVLSAIADSGIVGKEALEEVALTVIQDYKARVAEAVANGASKSEAIAEFHADPKLMVQRVQNAVVDGITERVKENYEGEFYIWLESTSVHKRPEHVKKYGKRFQIGRGEAPGDKRGCRCGMKILTPENKLELE